MRFTMIRKKSHEIPVEEEIEETPIRTASATRSYVEIPLPQFSFQGINRNNYTPILIMALLISSFLLGMLTTKISYLEKNDTNTLTQGITTTGVTPGAPAPSTPPQKVNVKQGHLPILGNKDAKITIVEFSDFQCPFCKRFEDETWAQLKKEYIDTGKAKLAFRQFPLTSIHPNAQKSAEASECANEQGKFWEMHDTLFKNQDTWAPKSAADVVIDFTTYAGELGLNTDQFSGCVSSGKFAKAVTDDAAEGSTAGVTGTPAFIINGYLLVGAQPLSAFKAQIDPLLK
ncbi:hypothetical protein BH11PAT1_BH11PAT1_1110 [soil metagenome]